ncbi:MAG: FKBP-type peptidyl-prolyl cis-trans isomerase [Calditrichaeota bacterium]|nr:FKBP-type peptidyl-prolyl cis-trans isomerase [Calditrichota bacterium]HQU70970.1 FKBP-type peptidyl-prolyl cis-trans isomerase [Calditrichia bacterium]
MISIEAHLQEKGIDNAQNGPDGIFYTVEREGDGPLPQKTEHVVVHYTGKFLDGKVFDSSIPRDHPFIFQVGEGQVIPGWEKGIPLFRAGSKGTLYIPPALAYGKQGAGDVIPPDTPLAFEIEVLGVIPDATYQEMLKEAQQEAEAQAAEGKARLETDMEIIAGYAKKEGLQVQITESGLSYAVEAQGGGPRASAGQEVKVHYKGTFLDGTVFDSSFERGQPIQFPLGMGRVIRGWDEGIALFNQGGKGTLLIPSYLAYGPRDQGPIPANSVLRFDIEVVEVG